MAVSPACQIKDGGGAYGPTTNGVNVTPGDTISIQLISVSGVGSWAISCIGTDELSNAATVNASLVIDNLNKIATFTAPVAGREYIFQSKVNGGIDVNGAAQPSYTTTFAIYTLGAAGGRVIAVNETVEGNASFGWIAPVNAVLRFAAYTPALLVDFASTTSTSAQSTNLTVAVGATDVWLVEFGGTWSLASGTSGAKIAFSIPTGAIIEGNVYGTGATLSSSLVSRISAGATLSSAFNTVATTDAGFEGSVRVKMDGAHAGNVTLQVAPVGAVVLTVRKGSWMRASRVVEV